MACTAVSMVPPEFAGRDDEPVVPGGGAMGPAAWENTKDRSGGGLGAAVRVEDALPNRVLHAGVPVGGTEQREAAAFSVHGVLPSRKRHVSPSVATFPHTEADQTQSVERTACSSEDHLRISELPLRAALGVRKDRDRHHFAVAFGHDGPP